jgi:tetratricopeptide (TPR) repeat protein
MITRKPIAYLLGIAALALAAALVLCLWLQIRAKSPSNYELKFLEGVLFERQGKYGDAIDTLKAAIEIDPNRFEAYFYLADLELRQGKTNSAILNYELALKYCGASPTNLIPSAMQERETANISAKIRQLKQIAE